MIPAAGPSWPMGALTPAALTLQPFLGLRFRYGSGFATYGPGGTSLNANGADAVRAAII